MKLKPISSKNGLVSEGNHTGTIISITGKPDEINPKKVIIGFEIENNDKVEKELSASLEEGSPLRRDVETILGRPLNKSEITDGFDLASLIGRTCQVVVIHKSGAGGKPVAVVGLVLPATVAQTEAKTAA